MSAGCLSVEPLDATGQNLANETRQLAERLQYVATVAAACAKSNTNVGPPTRDYSTSPCLDSCEIVELQQAEQLFFSAEAEAEAHVSRAASTTARLAREAAECKESEVSERNLATEMRAKSFGCFSSEDYENQCRERIEHEAALSARHSELEVQIADAESRAEEQSRHHKISTDRLKLECAEAESRCQASLQEAKGLASESSNRRLAGEATNIEGQLEKARAQEEALQEERARLKEELGSLRFSLKDMKRFQHQQAQELDGQVKRLERQRRKLEDEQAVRQRNEQEVSAAEVASTEIQLKRLQQLNGLLTTNAREARVGQETKQQQAAQLLAERERLGPSEEQCAHENNKIKMRLDELSEIGGTLKSEARKLRNQEELLKQQVETLEKATRKDCEELEDAEQAYGEMREEEQNAERLAEIMKWKLCVAETQLHGTAGNKRGRGSAGARDCGTSVSSESPAGAASGELAGLVAGSSGTSGKASGTRTNLPAYADANAPTSASTSHAFSAGHQPEFEPPP